MKRPVFIFQLLFASLLGVQAAERPNILWLTSEDNSTRWVGCYGNPRASTPNIDRLAKEGFQYMHAYANGPACAISRATWITGMFAVSTGALHMRSNYNIPHDKIRYYPDFLRDAGYFTANGPKTDYNIGGRSKFDCWDRRTYSEKDVDWKQLKEKQPFFQVVNFGQSHESQAKIHLDELRHDPSAVKLRAYHPDLPVICKNYARYLDCVENMDRTIGDVLKGLRDAGLADNTIVVYCSDHGGVMPRSKRFLFEEALHSPLIVYIPKQFKALWPAQTPGSKIDRMVSFVDMPKTFLSITGSKVPNYMQGHVFLGPQTEPEQKYNYAFRGRVGEVILNARALCDKEFLYIRNYQPFTPWMQKDNYMWGIPATKAWDDYVKSGKATEVEARYFKPSGQPEELYDMRKDPDSVNNLIENPEYSEVAQRLRRALREQQIQAVDTALLPECEMIRMAVEHQSTIFEVARDPALYDTATLLNAADLALAENPANAVQLTKMLDSSNLGLRYWGITGCLLLEVKGVAQKCLNDESQVIRALAAWLSVKTGETDRGYEVLKDLINTPSYASLFVLNVLDWMKDDVKPLLTTLEEMPHKPFPQYYGSWFAKGRVDEEIRMQHTILTGYGHKAPPLPSYGKWRKNKKK